MTVGPATVVILPEYKEPLPSVVRRGTLYDELGAPPVVDAADFLRAPRRYLVALCDLVGVGFTDRMLSWPPGPRDSDGVWAPHWYASVWRSTGFEPYRPRRVSLDGDAAAVAERCGPAYRHLYARRLLL